MASLVYDGQEGFAGGINPGGLTAFIPQNQFAAMTNVRVLESGEIAKRPGLRSLYTMTTYSPSNINTWRNGSGVGEVVFNDTNGALRVATYNPSTAALTVTATYATGNPSVGISAAPFFGGGNPLLFLGVNSGKVVILPSGAALGAATPDALTAVWVYNQRLFGCRSGINQTIFWSGLNDGTTLGDTANGGGSATIRTFSNDAILGGFSLGAIMVIVHTSSLSVFRGRTFDDIQIQAGTEGLAPDIGGVLGSSWQVVDHVGYLMSVRGVFLITPNGSVQSYQEMTGLRDPVADLLLSSYAVQNAAIIDNARRKEIWFVLQRTSTVGATPDQIIFIYSKTLRCFSGQVSFPDTWALAGAVAAISPAGSGDSNWPQVMFAANRGGSANLGIVGCDFADPSLEQFADFATHKYTSSVQCRRFFTDEPRSRKAWSKAFVMMGSGALGTAAVDSATGATVSYTTPIGGTVSPSTALGAGEVNQVPLSGSGHCLDLTITDSGTSSTGWSVNSVEVMATDDGLVGH